MEPINPDPITYFAQTNFRGEGRKFGIKRDDRRRHMYVIGKTGMGKSTMLENMIIQDIANGEGVAVVDPHGDLVEKVIDFIPPERMKDVIYFNPADLNHPIAFNIVEEVDDEYKNLIANGLVGVFKKIWAESWGPRLEYILINTILSLLDYPGATLLGVTRMLVDPGYRKKVMKKIKDPIVLSFWVNEYNNYSEKFRNEAIAPIQNKVGQFLSSALIRNIVGQEKSTIDVRKEMDAGKIFLMNLSKGRIGEENAALLGAMMITRIQLAAMSRVDIPEDQRRDFFLYVDEFQNFSTESFAGILSEARKYRLNITMAHQYIEQLSEEVKAAVFGNVGTMVAFRVGATDAEELEKEFQPTFMQEHIVQLPSFHVYLRLMIDGVASDPFSATTLPPISEPYGLRDQIIEASRAQYATNRMEVEHSIQMWAAVDDNQVQSLKEKYEKDLQKKQEAEAASLEPLKLTPEEKLAAGKTRNGIPLPPGGLESLEYDEAPDLTDDVPTISAFLETGFDDPVEDVADIQAAVETAHVPDFEMADNPLNHAIDFLSAFTEDESVAEAPAEVPRTVITMPVIERVVDEPSEVVLEGDEATPQLQQELASGAVAEAVTASDSTTVPAATTTTSVVAAPPKASASPTQPPASTVTTATSARLGATPVLPSAVAANDANAPAKRKRKRKRKKKTDEATAEPQMQSGPKVVGSVSPSPTHQPFRAALEQLADPRTPSVEERRAQRDQGALASVTEPIQPQQQSRQQSQQSAPQKQPHVIQPGQHVTFD